VLSPESCEDKRDSAPEATVDSRGISALVAVVLLAVDVAETAAVVPADPGVEVRVDRYESYVLVRAPGPPPTPRDDAGGV